MDEKKDIVIIANFCDALNEATNNRFAYMSQILSVKFNVELVTSSFDHAEKRQIPVSRIIKAKEFSYKVTVLHSPNYPANICAQRLFSHYVWGQNVLHYLEHRKRPDLVYCAVPSLTGPNLVSKYCEYNHVPFFIDVQDLWPEAFQMVVNLPIVSDIAFTPFRTLADSIYKRADQIVAVSQTYVDRALKVNEKVKKGHVVFLGTDLSTFDENVKNATPVIKREEGILKIAYCGTLGGSYDLTCVIDALALIKRKGITPPAFIVMGDGPRKNEFEEYARKKKVNALFTGRLPYPVMCATLMQCDINVNPITHGAAQSIINKHADYAASGHPVLNTQENREYRKLVHDYKMGFNCKNGNAEDLARKLIRISNNERLRKEMGQNARACAAEKFDRRNSYKEIIRLIQEQL